MKFILIVLFAFITLAFAGESSQNWFRIANHLGTSLPAALKFKSCGLADSVYVNAKDSGRFGFGYDVPASDSDSGFSMCGNGCGDKKRSIIKDDEERGEESGIVAVDSAVNFMIYWTANSDGSFSTADKIFTRISNGDVAYSLDTNSIITVSNVDQASRFVSVGGNNVKSYPAANFQFFSDNHVVTQNWYYEQVNPDYNCASNSEAFNDVVTVFPAGAAGTSYKTRVSFTFADSCDTSEADGLVSVSVIENNGNLETHIRSLNGAFALGAPWISNIDVLVTDASDSSIIYIQSSSSASGLPSGASSSYTQLCNHKALTPTALKRRSPLVSSSQ